MFEFISYYQFILPIISLIIALILYSALREDFKFSSDAEEAAAIIMLILGSLIFYPIFIAFGIVAVMLYISSRVYRFYHGRRYYMREIDHQNHYQDVQSTAYYLPEQDLLVTQDMSESVQVENDSDISLQMDLTEED